MWPSSPPYFRARQRLQLTGGLEVPAGDALEPLQAWPAAEVARPVAVLFAVGIGIGIRGGW